MSIVIRVYVYLCLCLPLLPAIAASQEPEAKKAVRPITAQQIAFFESKIRPLLINRCYKCHSGDEPQSGLSLESRGGLLRGGTLGAALVPGSPSKSLLISAIKHDEFLKMPPKAKLSTREVLDLTKWVKLGAIWPHAKPLRAKPKISTSEGVRTPTDHPSHWAFLPVTDPTPPNTGSLWPQSPIDQFVEARLRSIRLAPAPPAGKRTLIRRATFDLTGLSPTPSEVAAFLQDDSPNAFATVVDRLLASPHYGERWGRHWLDVARYADSNGLDENLSYANAFRYRDYVISSFNSDKPYSRFVEEQIAGDLLPEVIDERQNLDRHIATGFLAIGAKMLAEDDPVKMQMDIIDEQISTLGQAFMALTIGCARCHDHKFDPIPTEDYYSLAGIFKSSKTMENHKVVAVWYERPLVSRSVTKIIERIDQEVIDASKEIDELKVSLRDSVARQIQQRFSDYLLAAADYRRFQENDEVHRPTITPGTGPFPVHNGFARIEAESFQRGNVEKLFDGYGEGIGIIATRGAGFAEFDLDVELAGDYSLEIRHAAAGARPVNLIVNGEIMDAPVAGHVTGNWYPAGQRWFTAGTFELNAGANKLRLESSKVYPHIDRLAIVYAGPKPWPFPSKPPKTIKHIASEYGVNLELVKLLQDFLTRDDQPNRFPSFKAWLAFSRLDETRFTQAAQTLIAELSSSEGLGATTPEAIKKRLVNAELKTLRDVSRVYQEVLDSLKSGSQENDGLREEWYQAGSPLLGPTEISPAILSSAEKHTLQLLEEKLVDVKASRPTYDAAMGVTEGEPADLRIHMRGSHLALGPIAPRGFPRLVNVDEPPSIGHSESGRLQLAHWLTRPDHPLVGRVIVNRVWHWRFGRGLSSTVDNFGILGEPPSHPRLLDWLTKRFLESGGSLKKLHRMMMLSSTYQMSTTFDNVANSQDPENEYLWRFRRRRLTAEEIRDTLISLGTGLDARMGGTLLKVKNRAYVTSSGSNVTDEYDNARRSVYVPVVRSAVYDVFQTFDFPDPAVATGIRQTSTVAPQALMMMNSELVDRHTRALADRLLRLPSDRDRITTVFELVLNRQPRIQEIETASQFVRHVQLSDTLEQLDSHEVNLRAWQSYCRVLLSSNEFSYIE